MSSFVVLVGLQFYILFIIQENFVIADEKTSLETSKRQVVGQCGDRKSDPLDTKIHWKDACYDFDGNSYKDGDFLMSCCGCFKFICRNKTKEEPPCDDKYGWDKVLEATCCEDCHGQVFPAGSVIKEQKLQDKCSTTVTTKCVLASGEKKATIDESLSYEKCCSNSSGVYPLNTSVLVPALCSVRVCSRPSGRHEASWTLTKKTTGCDCCQYRGKLIADKDWVIIGTGYNARNATCCEGKLLVSIDDEDVSSTTSEDETVGITTNVDEEIGITQEVEKSSRSVLVIGPVPWITATVEDFSLIPSNSSIPDPGLDYYFSKNGGYSVCKVINGTMYLCDSYNKWCISYNGSGLQWKLEKEMKLEVTRAHPADTLSPGDQPRWIIQGGVDSFLPGRKYRGIVEVWTPESGKWRIDSNYTSPQPNDIGCIVVIEGKILQVGGRIVSPINGKVIYTNRVFLGDVEVASMMKERIYHDCTMFENRVWVAGGVGYTSANSHTVEIYDYKTDIWTAGPRIPANDYHTIVGKLKVIKGDLYFICRDCGKIFKLINNEDVYTWEAVADIPKNAGYLAEIMEIGH